MIKRPTWILLVILILVIGAYFLVKNRPAGSAIPTPTSPGENYLITKADGTLQSLHIEDTQNHVFQMQRDPNGAWIVALPKPAIADQALAGAAETQVGALRIVTILDTPPDLSDVKLDAPSYLITLGFASGATHTLDIGSLTPTSSGYYVRYDDGTIYVISQSGIDALLNLLSAPPYPATETPIPTPEPTATMTPEILTPSP